MMCWWMGVCNSVYILVKLVMLFGEGEVLCFFSVLYLEYVFWVVNFFCEIGGCVLLMYGIEGEVYVNL